MQTLPTCVTNLAKLTRVKNLQSLPQSQKTRNPLSCRHLRKTYEPTEPKLTAAKCHHPGICAPMTIASPQKAAYQIPYTENPLVSLSGSH